MSLVVAFVIGLVVLFVAHATALMRVDAPVNPPGVAKLRRRYDFWKGSGQNGLRYVVGIVIGLLIGLHVRPDPPAGQNVDVSAPAGRSPDRASVVSTLNDYFAGRPRQRAHMPLHQRVHRVVPAADDARRLQVHSYLDAGGRTHHRWPQWLSECADHLRV